MWYENNGRGAMERTELTEELERAEGLLLQGEGELAERMLAHLADDAEAYVDANCPTTDELQWFSFPSLFERLAYRRVEGDPRELRDVGEPLSRLYSDLALARVHLEDYEAAAAAATRGFSPAWNQPAKLANARARWDASLARSKTL